MKQRTQIQGVTEVTVDVFRPKKDKVIRRLQKAAQS
jgi:hypothetical protein